MRLACLSQLWLQALSVMQPCTLKLHLHIAVSRGRVQLASFFMHSSRCSADQALCVQKQQQEEKQQQQQQQDEDFAPATPVMSGELRGPPDSSLSADLERLASSISTALAADTEPSSEPTSLPAVSLADAYSRLLVY